MKISNKNIPGYDLDVFFQGTLSTGSDLITGVVGSQYIEKGDYISHPNIPAGSFITNINEGEVSISQAATANALGTVITLLSRFNGLEIRKYVRKTMVGCEEYLYRTIFLGKDSLEVGADGYCHLVGDALNPGNNQIYATNSSGVKGWYSANNVFGSVVSTNTNSVPTTIPNGSAVVGNSLSLPAGTYLIFAYARIPRQLNGQILINLKDGASVIIATAVEVSVPDVLNQNFNLSTVYTSGLSISLTTEFTGNGAAQTTGLRERTLTAIKIG